MATNERPRSGAKAPAKRMSAKQRAAKKKRKIILFGVEIVVILIMAAVLYLVMDTTQGEMHVTYIDPQNVGISDTVQELTSDEGAGTMRGYMNIALFGVDAKTEKELYKSSRSDSIMVANINLATGDIKLVSVFRDTYLNRGNDTYNKCNGAYSLGGAEQAVRMLNMNLDLDITDFVTVGYAGLAEVIDGLGGVWIDVSEQELKYINSYQCSIIGRNGEKYWKEWSGGGSWDSENLNFKPDEYFENYDVKRVTESGYQLLNGLQATAYCRIRYVGNDFERTARQRKVIKGIEDQAKKAGTDTLIKVFQSAADDIYTNLSADDILELLPRIADYKIVDEATFPDTSMRVTVSMGAKGSCEVPLDLEASVVDLHEFLYNDNVYQVSDTVKEISQKISEDSGPYRRGN